LSGDLPEGVDDLALMTLHADIGYVHDGAGRLLRTNELEARPAPLVFLGMTRAGQVLRLGAEASGEVERAARRMLAEPLLAGDFDELPARASEFAAVAPLGRFGPVFVADGTPDGGTSAVRVTPANVHVAADTFPWLARELSSCEPCFGVVEQGAIVSVCFSSRVGATAVAAGVETLPAFRGRGFGAAATAAWAAHARRTGKRAFYSTRWDNRGSLGIARRVGFRLFGAELTWG